MEYLAHSAKGDCPPQTYQRHVEGVRALAEKFVQEVGGYAQQDAVQLKSIVQIAVDAHDIGKLDSDNQAVLHHSNGAKHLPVHHQDAGTALLMRKDAGLAAYLVQSHHLGLNDMADEASEDRPMFRDADQITREHVNRTLDTLVRLQHQLIESPEEYYSEDVSGDLQVFLRIALSCLADADYTDTARHYGQYPIIERMPMLLAEERLAQLDAWVASLDRGDERNSLRREMYFNCRDSNQTSVFSTCDSPVGSGKTTAIMAHLLKQAIVRGARRIFVVLPYTSIISQSVDIYRKYLTLPWEDAEKVVAELHYRADFENEDTRYLTALWRAPIIVTTAVAFYETIAANKPSSLRRLHELPGSMIFIDECHAALPVRLLPVAWHWMKVLGEEWGCYWVLASGSLVRFWQLQNFTRDQVNVRDLVSEELRNRLLKYEKQRTSFRCEPFPKSRQSLIKWVQSCPGPRLLIVNTVQSAAVLADDLRKAYGRACVEHLSTALTAEDRESIMKCVGVRLKNNADQDWTLVATSCVEAGIDFSFRTGFRELSSLLSLLQAAGRVNRQGRNASAEMWSFKLQDDPMLTRNPSTQISASILERFFKRGIEINPELTTNAIMAELNEDNSMTTHVKTLWEQESEGAFRTLAKKFVVIDSDTATIVSNDALVDQLRCGKADWYLLQRQGINIPQKKAQAYRLEEIASDVFRWHLGYDGFLGYMAGVIK